ncbi:hypothetical protein FE236_04195 [Mariprofundus erugo]|uniref:Fibronectin type III domain-containing protein n=1 Tax=Mariprofundus erugo TaxID=2528639 RepID=A0A5R9GMQ5_9PROT|nr:hypothetical protein [Mariprofundus erugo]TLS66958.1 hypothetical protein FEF65_08325 [Mariprofundus erugo]TLS77341.1 hypothetical protein FE236_04195 [Mariprofundus erugo]
MRKIQLFGTMLLISVLLLSACGRKEAPQIAGTEKPQISDLRDQVVGNVLELQFVLSGNEHGVGFQVDRTELDPYCQCPGMWRRLYDRAAMPGQTGETKKLIKLKNDKTEYLFRIRAYDADGNLGPWSHAIHAKGVDLYK